MRRFSIQSLLGLCASLLLAACGSGGQPAAAPTPPNQTTLQPTTSVVEATQQLPTPAPTPEPTRPPPTVTLASEPIVIGVLVDNEGTFADYGTDAWQGFQLGLEYATGGSMMVANRPIEVVRKDIGQDLEAAISAAQRLSGRAAILVGPVQSQASLSVGQIAMGNRTIYFSLGAAPRITAEAFNPNIFRLCHISPPDGPIVPPAAQEQISTEYFAYKDIVAFPGDVTIGQVGLIPYHFSFANNPVNDWFVKEYRSRYGVPPDLKSECAFASAQALVEALEATNGDTDEDVLVAALEGLSFEGPRGNYTIRAEDHQGLAPVYVVRLNNIDDPQFDFFELLQEIPGSENGYPCAAARCK